MRRPAFSPPSRSVRLGAALVFGAAAVASPAMAQQAGAARDGARADGVRPDVALADSARMARVLAGLRPTVEAVGRPPVRWTLAERLAHYRVPGASVAVIAGGRVAWARGVGVKSAGAAGAADSVTPATLFQAASISKPVTATAALRLVDQGTLALDADANRYLRTWKVPAGPLTASQKVTVRRLLSHTAGLTVHGFPGYAADGARPTLVQVLDGRPPANTEPVRVDAVPGTLARYSGGGYVVLQQLLSDVTGQPFPALMQSLVLGPAGMARSTFAQPLPPERAAGAARAHDAEGATVPGGWHVYPEQAPAGLWTTPTDLARWALAVAGAGAPGAASAGGLLAPATAAAMRTRQTARARKAPDMPGEVGLGPFVSGAGRERRLEHGGVNEGFVSNLVFYPDLGVGAVVMANGDGAHLLLRELELALAAEYGWPGVGPQRVRVVALDSRRAAHGRAPGGARRDAGAHVRPALRGRDGHVAVAVAAACAPRGRPAAARNVDEPVGRVAGGVRLRVARVAARALPARVPHEPSRVPARVPGDNRGALIKGRCCAASGPVSNR
jgi:CubicO group peptidase (beta-lactamase class C family)